MSEIKELDVLRELIETSRHEYEMGNVSYVVGFNDIADAIEAEVAERFMELPVDADGIPIHVGDRLVRAVGDGIVHIVAMLKFDGRYWWYESSNDCFSCDGSMHKPRTVEDVLKEFAKRVLNSGHQWGLDAEETTAEYADELRGLIGGAE